MDDCSFCRIHTFERKFFCPPNISVPAQQFVPHFHLGLPFERISHNRALNAQTHTKRNRACLFLKGKERLESDHVKMNYDCL